MKKEDIKLVTQKRDNDCVLACLAMVSGKNLDEIHQLCLDFKGDISYSGITLLETLYLLTKLQINYILYAHPIIVSDRLYMLTVPSLNMQGGNHCIIVYSDEFLNFTVLDPAQEDGKDYRYYTPEKLLGYSEVVEIIL